jgi:hypothetical protein
MKQDVTVHIAVLNTRLKCCILFSRTTFSLIYLLSLYAIVPYLFFIDLHDFIQ